MPLERTASLNQHIMLFYTGIKRTASQVAETYVNDIAPRRRQLRILLDLVKEGLAVLSGHQDLGAFGELLHEAWLVKRSLSTSVSNSHVDEIYQDARSAGAIGGKLLGAGGGGFIMLFAPPECHDVIREKLKGLIYVPCQFEFSGSQVIFFDRETDYAREEESRRSCAVNPFEELREKFTPLEELPYAKPR
jgi:D-glycero-alpha-D-manno-heptose-7-phosphate kinase